MLKFVNHKNSFKPLIYFNQLIVISNIFNSHIIYLYELDHYYFNIIIYFLLFIINYIYHYFVNFLLSYHTRAIHFCYNYFNFWLIIIDFIIHRDHLYMLNLIRFVIMIIFDTFVIYC